MAKHPDDITAVTFDRLDEKPVQNPGAVVDDGWTNSSVPSYIPIGEKETRQEAAARRRRAHIDSEDGTDLEEEYITGFVHGLHHKAEVTCQMFHLSARRSDNRMLFTSLTCARHDPIESRAILFRGYFIHSESRFSAPKTASRR